MRVTLHLDSFDRLDPSAYAIIWIDTATKKWSREGHAGVSVPEWGQCHPSVHGTSLLALENQNEVCTLEGLDLGASDGPFEGESGAVLWRQHLDAEPTQARWSVQCVDESTAVPEDTLFPDEL
jgi:hypothetical protein